MPFDVGPQVTIWSLIWLRFRLGFHNHRPFHLGVNIAIVEGRPHEVITETRDRAVL
jgi:hypothetical protein